MATPADTDRPSASTSAAGDEAAADAANNERQAAKLLDRVVQGAHQTIDKLAEQAAPHVQRIEEGVHGASDTLHARANQARDVSSEWADSLRSTVRENPLAAVATALAVGLLIARLTR